MLSTYMGLLSLGQCLVIYTQVKGMEEESQFDII